MCSDKTTLLDIMGGLDQPTSGRLFFRNLELTGLNDRDLTNYRRQHVGFVFQFYNLVPSLTAYENVALVTEISEHPIRPAVLLCDEPTGALANDLFETEAERGARLCLQ
jgi:putative ABC transport system ATP-binding protein